MKDVQGVLRHSRTATTTDVYMQEIPESVQATVEFHQHGVEKVAVWDDAKARAYDCYFSREAVTKSCGGGRSHSKFDTK